MNLLSRLLGRFQRPVHMTWGGDLANPFTPIWEPNPLGEIR